jgi:ubiquitin C-terminal hydrolase
MSHPSQNKNRKPTTSTGGIQKDENSTGSIHSPSQYLHGSSQKNEDDHSHTNQFSPQQSINVGYYDVNQQQNFSSMNFASVNSHDQCSYKSRVCGFQNLGNTCYMNGILQCLNSTPPLVDHVCQSRNFGKNGSLSKSFANLLQDICQSNSSVVRPSSIKASVGSYTPKFLGYQQQDSHEFLTVFFEALVEETTDSNGYSIISGLFEGQMEYTIKCLHSGCPYQKVDTDPFTILSLFIEDKNSSPQKDPNSFRVRYINHDGLVQLDDISISPTDTIGSLNAELQHKANCDICAMKINEKNEFAHEYSPSVRLSSIKDEMTIFYEIVKDDPQHTNALLQFRHTNSVDSGFIHPPTVIQILKASKECDIVIEIRKHLWNLFGSGDDFSVSQDSNRVSFWRFLSDEMVFNILYDQKDMKNFKSKLMNESAPQDIGNQMTTFNKSQSTSGTTLEQCLKNISAIEYMSSNSVWYCSTCQQQRRASKQNRLLSISKVLVIQLKRFNFNSSSPYHKVERLVQYPLVLDMKPFLPSESHDRDSPLLYDLIGVCLHSGSLAGGHTTAYVKHSVTNQWYYCNDSQVYRIPENEVINRNPRDAYILFYLRRSDQSSAALAHESMR